MGRFLGALLTILILDQASKHVVLYELGLLTEPDGEILVLPPYLQFRMAWNTGINFGLFGSEVDAMRWILIAVALVISAVLTVWALRTGGWRVPILAGVVVGGALGNVWDRIVYGAVADFLNMSCCGIRNPYAFNVADIAIFVGALGLVLFAGPTDKKQA
ncbi:MAG: signal peptidase II [Pseudomonadota bacterium]